VNQNRNKLSQQSGIVEFIVSSEAVTSNNEVITEELSKLFHQHGIENRISLANNGARLDELAPSYADSEIVILGVNTARSLTIKGGRINRRQVRWLKEQFYMGGPSVVKIVVTHHPVDLPEGSDARVLVGRARMAMEELAGCGADLLLAGHMHISYAGQTAKRYKLGGKTAVVIQAGTASSTRSRGESNSFNVIRITYPEISIERHRWHPTENTFIGEITDRFRRANKKLDSYRDLTALNLELTTCNGLRGHDIYAPPTVKFTLKDNKIWKPLLW